MEYGVIDMDRLDSLGGWGSVEGQEAGITKGTGEQGNTFVDHDSIVYNTP